MNSAVQKTSNVPTRLGAAAAWTYSILVGLTGLAVIVEHQLPAGVLLLVSALAAFPPTSVGLHRWANIRIPVWAKAAAAIVLLLVGAALLPKPPATQSASTSEATFVAAPQGAALAKLLLLDDFKGYLEGHKVVGDWSSTAPLGRRISASQLFAAYHENEVSADNQFKGKPLVVTGYIDSINKDMFNNGFIVLHDQNEFEGVHASLTDESMKSAGNLSRGQEITLLCTGGGMVIGSPVLKECDAVDVILSQKRAAVENMVDQFFSDAHDQPESIRRMIAYGYAIGAAMPRPNACQTATPGDMQKCSQDMRAIPAAERKRRYLELSNRFALPPLPEASPKP